MSPIRLPSLILIVLLLAGCNPGPAVGTVSGTVTLDGEPIKQGRISFTPVDGMGQTGGAEIVEGKYKADVPAAKMKVEINGNKVIGKRLAYEGTKGPYVDEVVELVPPKYNVNSELTLDVQRGAQEKNFELKK
jgi:hypothetical protein